MSWKSRLEKSMFAGAVAGLAATWYEATRRHAALARAAKSAAHGHNPSVATVLAAGFVTTTVITGLAVFIITTLVTVRWRRRSLARARRDYGGYSRYGSGYGGDW